MARTILISLQKRTVRRTVRIRPNWAGEGIAIHKPIEVDPETGSVGFQQIRGLWNLTHIPTGMAMGSCMGSLDRAKGFAQEWDATFAALKPGEKMAPDRLQAWGKVIEEMKIEPPRKPTRLRRGHIIAAEVV